jgi:hypothetical protein
MENGKDKVIEILMNRDGSDRYEAEEQVDECIRRCNDAIQGGKFILDDIIQDELGLEPDFLEDILPGVF